MWLRLLLLALAACLSLDAHAQDYPNHPLRLVVGYAAGGGTDSVARVMARRLSEGLGQPVVVDNKPGGAGVIATQLAVSAPPDGYTLLAGNIGPIAVYPFLYKLPYDPLRDLEPVMLIATAPLLVVANNDLPVNSLQELIKLAHDKPGKLSYSSAGVGSSNHLAGALFNIQAGTDIQHVPYKGAAPAVEDLLSGQVQVSFQTLPSVGSFVKAGRVKALAVTSDKRSPAFPNVPTAAEAGLNGFEVAAWYSMMVPAHTPRPIVDRLNAELAKAMKEKDVLDILAADGAVPAVTTPEAFATFMRSEAEKWSRVVKISGMKAEQ